MQNNKRRKINYQKRKLLEAQDHTPRFWYKGVFTCYDIPCFKDDKPVWNDGEFEPNNFAYQRKSVDIILGLDGAFTTGYKILDDNTIQLVTIYGYGKQSYVDQFLPKSWKHGDILTFREFIREYRKGILNYKSYSQQN